MAAQWKKRWPLAATIAFLLVFSASFMTWGTIRHHYTWQFMAYMDHPGLTNRIPTTDDLSNLKQGAKLNLKGSAWKAGFDIFGFFYPHMILSILAFLLFACALFRFYDYFLINPTIPLLLSFYGVIHVTASALGFFSQGSVGWGLILTGSGYLVFTIVFLRWK